MSGTIRHLRPTAGITVRAADDAFPRPGPLAEHPPRLRHRRGQDRRPARGARPRHCSARSGPGPPHGRRRRRRDRRRPRIPVRRGGGQHLERAARRRAGLAHVVPRAGHTAPTVPVRIKRSTPPDSDTPVRSRIALDRLIARRDIHVREKTRTPQTCSRHGRRRPRRLPRHRATRGCPTDRPAPCSTPRPPPPDPAPAGIRTSCATPASRTSAKRGVVA